MTKTPRVSTGKHAAASEGSAQGQADASDGSRHSTGSESATTVSLHQRVSPRHSESSVTEKIQEHIAFDHQDVSADDTDSWESPVEIQEQLDRVAELVDTYNLAEPTFADSSEQDAWDKIRETHDTQSSLTSNLITADVSDSDLTKMSFEKATQLVATLRQDKARLQKLVLAQQSALEAERESHDQSRLLARDAIKIMRDSRAAQKRAAKIAHRERAERLSIEVQCEQAALALENALSIIEQKKYQ